MYDIAIVGTGRVGLPLLIAFAKEGFKVIGIEKNYSLVSTVKKGVYPFKEENGSEYLRSVLDRITLTNDDSDMSKAETVIVTVGTPLRENLEVNLSSIARVARKLTEVAKVGQMVILRSTVAVGTTDYVINTIEESKGWKLGREFFAAFAPERILEGKAFEELYKIPQIIGVKDDESFKKASYIFSKISPEIIKTTIRGAELIKLFNNTSRYVYFAIVNYFLMISEMYGEDIHELLEKANKNYPRKILFSPGLTGGPCLRKDFAMISETVPNIDILTSAWKVNEFLPVFLISSINRRTNIKGKNIAVLGLTFKRDSDDLRESLVIKLLRYLVRYTPKAIKIHDPNLPREFKIEVEGTHLVNAPLDEVLLDSDIVIFAMNHSYFEENFESILNKVHENVLICDPWGIGKVGKLFYKADDAR